MKEILLFSMVILYMSSNTTKLYVDSYARSSTEPCYQFLYPMKDTLRNVKSVSLTDAQIPLTYYNVNCSQGFYFSEDNVTTKIAWIQAGNYDSNSIITALTSAIALVSTRIYTLTISTITNKFNISCATTFKIISPAIHPTINYLIGFDTGSTSMNTSQIGDSCIRLDGLLYLYLELTIPQIRSYEAYGLKTCFYKIPVDVTYGSIIMFNANPSMLDIDKYDVSSFQVRLLDHDWNIVDLNGRDFSFTLTIETTDGTPNVINPKYINYQTK